MRVRWQQHAVAYAMFKNVDVASRATAGFMQRRRGAYARVHTDVYNGIRAATNHPRNAAVRRSGSVVEAVALRVANQNVRAAGKCV